MTPFRDGFAITPADGTDLTTVPEALVAYTTAGTCKVDLVSGATVTIYLALGIPVFIQPKRVYATGTAAAGITGLRF